MNKILPIILVVVLFFPELSFGYDDRNAWEPRSGGGGGFFTTLIFYIVLFFLMIHVICNIIFPSIFSKETPTEIKDKKQETRTSFLTNQSSDVITIIVIIGIVAYFFLFK